MTLKLFDPYGFYCISSRWEWIWHRQSPHYVVLICFSVFFPSLPLIASFLCSLSFRNQFHKRTLSHFLSLSLQYSAVSVFVLCPFSFLSFNRIPFIAPPPGSVGSKDSCFYNTFFPPFVWLPSLFSLFPWLDINYLAGDQVAYIALIKTNTCIHSWDSCVYANIGSKKG